MLEALFNPTSIAVVGASSDPKKVGFAILNNLIRCGYRGRLYPINLSAKEILGVRAYHNVSSVNDNVSLAVVAVPARFVPDTLLDCANAGVGAAVIISAGFKEAGPEGMKLEDKVRNIAGDKKIRLLGPNCLGVMNTSNSMNATFAAGMLPRGRMSFFSQSGALGIAILDWAIGNRVGFSKFISLGNKADLSEIDFLEYFVQDPETDVILGYIEDVVDGKRFMEIAERATKSKPVVLIKAGGTESGARAASSHTGALAGSDIAFDAAFKQTGVMRARGIQDLFEIGLAFSERKLPAGNGLLILTNAGGPGILAADTADRLGLKLTQMSKTTIESIAGRLPANASLYNPVDIIGDATSERYAIVLGKAIEDPGVHGIVMILTPQAMINVEETADLVISASQTTDKPIITSFMGEARVRESIDRLEANSIPNYSYPEAAVRAFKWLSDYNTWRKLPADSIPLFEGNRGEVENIIGDHLQSGTLRLIEDDAMNLLSHCGFRFPRRYLARTSREAAVIASKIGFPLVMKISSPDILHKTDVGGVKIGVTSKKEAEEAFVEITSNVNRLAGEAFINGVMLYEMIQKGREVILGVTFDRTFGHMIMFGMGGIYVEVLKDVSFRIAPVSRREAFSMVGETSSHALLEGARGERPADIEAIVEGIMKLSALVAEFPEIQELDINPLLVMEKGAVGLDARIIIERP
jgi:acetyl coenzyme A synthetase (ADP forming)-like protein